MPTSSHQNYQPMLLNKNFQNSSIFGILIEIHKFNPSKYNNTHIDLGIFRIQITVSGYIPTQEKSSISPDFFFPLSSSLFPQVWGNGGGVSSNGEEICWVRRVKKVQDKEGQP